MTQQDGGSLETHVLSLVCGELSPILKESADLRAVGNRHCHFIRSPSRLRAISVISVPDLALADRAIYRARVLRIQNSG